MFDKIEKYSGIAYVSGEKSITYPELAVRMEAFCRYLLSVSAAPHGKPVGICSSDYYVIAQSLLSIKKLGYSYVIIEPELQAEAVEAIIRKYGVSCLITEREDITSVPHIDPSELSGYENMNTAPDHGYKVGGAAGIRLIDGLESIILPYSFVHQYHIALADALEIQYGRHIIINTRYLNSILISDIISSALIAGASIEVRNNQSKDISDNTINIMHKRLFREIVKEPCKKPQRYRNKTGLIIIGDTPLLNIYKKSLNKYYSGINISFLYYSKHIPLFLTINSDLGRNSADGSEITIVPIGKPIISGCIIANAWGNVSPVGSLGSLQLEINRPMETGKYLVKTPERGRYLPDKSIQIQSTGESVGKDDNPADLQLMEDYIYQFEPVKNAIAFKTDQSWKCYIIPGADCEDYWNGMISRIKYELPGCLWPEAIYLLYNMPEDIVGKVDLSHIEDYLMRTISFSEQGETQSELQILMLRIAKEILKDNTIGLSDDLFSRGLDSVKAIQIVMRMRDYNISIEVPEIFQNPSIKALSYEVQHIELNSKAENQSRGRYKEESRILIRNESDLKRVEEMFDADPNIEAIYPVSPMQELILAQNINYRNTGNDITLLRYILKGELDVDSFKKAWNEVINRHQILRTAFLWRKLKQPIQAVYNRTELPFKLIDISDKSGEEQNMAYSKLIEEEGISSFNISNPPLLKILLLKFGEREWRFVLKCQNSLFDGWSSNIIFNEFSLLYNAIKNHSEIEPAPYCPYIKYISWLDGQNADEARKYWIKEFKGFKETENPDTGPVHQVRNGFQPGEDWIRLEENDVQVLNKFVEKHHITHYIVFLGMWAVLQGKITGEQDLVVAGVTSGRPINIPNIENMVGLFSNTLPFRITLDGDKPGIKWLKHLQEKSIKQKAYDYVTIYQISEWCKIPMGVIQEAVYSRAMVYLNFPMNSSELAGSSIEIKQEFDAGYVNVPLRLYIQPANNFKIIIRYDKYYFNKNDIIAILKEYKNMVLDVCSN